MHKQNKCEVKDPRNTVDETDYVLCIIYNFDNF